MDMEEMQQLNTIDFEPGRNYYHPHIYDARVMTPREVTAALSPEYQGLPELQHRWMYCGDVTAGTFDLLQSAAYDDIDFRASAFRSTGGGNYCILTHQVQSRQHRFLLPLYEPNVGAAVRALMHEEHSFSLGRDNGSAAVILPRLASHASLAPLASFSQVPNDDEARRIVADFPFVMVLAGQIETIPSSLHGLTVTEVSLSIAMPVETLEKVFPSDALDS